MVILKLVAVLLLQFTATFAGVVHLHLHRGALDVVLPVWKLPLHQHHLHLADRAGVGDAAVGVNET